MGVRSGRTCHSELFGACRSPLARDGASCTRDTAHAESGANAALPQFSAARRHRPPTAGSADPSLLAPTMCASKAALCLAVALCLAGTAPVAAQVHDDWQAEGVREFARRTAAAAVADSPFNCSTFNFTQRLDHFNPADTRTWQQRYYVCNGYWHKGAREPLFAYLGAEGPLDAPYPSLFFDMIRDEGGLMLQMEHRCGAGAACHARRSLSGAGLLARSSATAAKPHAIAVLPHVRCSYYGTSQPLGPVESFTNAGLRYLTVENALRDFVAITAFVRKVRCACCACRWLRWVPCPQQRPPSTALHTRRPTACRAPPPPWRTAAPMLAAWLPGRACCTRARSTPPSPPPLSCA